MRVFTKSDVGLVREGNEDCCTAGTFMDGAVWAVVCDGMGGANGGEVASQLACNVVKWVLVEGYRMELEPDELVGLIRSAITEANTRVYQTAQNDWSLLGMGTTVVCAVVKGGVCYVVHAGDSRAYLISGGGIRRLTKDHSIVQELIDSGKITPEEASQHYSRHIITRALGTQPTLETDVNTAPFGEDDILLVCTDGLSNYFDDRTLLEMTQGASAEELPDRLIEKAKECGGNDNITVAVIEM